MKRQCVCDRIIEQKTLIHGCKVRTIKADENVLLVMEYYPKEYKPKYQDAIPAGWYINAAYDYPIRRMIQFCPFCGDRLHIGMKEEVYFNDLDND